MLSYHIFVCSNFFKIHANEIHVQFVLQLNACLFSTGLDVYIHTNIIFHSKQIKFHQHFDSKIEFTLRKNNAPDGKSTRCEPGAMLTGFPSLNHRILGIGAASTNSEISINKKKKTIMKNETLFVCVLCLIICVELFICSVDSFFRENVFVSNWIPTCFAIQCNGLVTGNGRINWMLGYSWYL